MIDLNALQQAFAATDNPSLPGVLASKVALHGMWALVLVTLVVLMLRRKSQRIQIAAAVVVGVGTLWFSSFSPAYWLGLAFMAPSWMTVALCVAWLYRHTHPLPVLLPSKAIKVSELVLALLGIALGWLLLADMLLWLPSSQSVYAWGFSSWAVLLGCVLAVLPWLVWGMRLLPIDGGNLSVLALPVFVMIAYVFTRLPSGNLWDALLDPWLWVWLQVYVFIQLVNVILSFKSKPPPP